jgi:hypothetical protein
MGAYLSENTFLALASFPSPQVYDAPNQTIMTDKQGINSNLYPILGRHGADLNRNSALGESILC